MKKIAGILLLILIVVLCSGALAVGFPSMEDPGDVYDNDTTTLVFHWTEGPKIRVSFSYRQGDHNFQFLEKTQDIANDTATFDLHLYPEDHYFPDGELDSSLWINIEGCYIDPETGEEEYTEAALETIEMKYEGVTEKPVLNIPEKAEKGQDIRITMPAAPADAVYRPFMTDSDGVTVFELSNYGDVWEAGKTYTIPGDAVLIDENYTFTVIAGKKRCLSTPSDKYRIVVGNPDPRGPVRVNVSLGWNAYCATRILDDNGIIRLKEGSYDFRKAERPSRLRLDENGTAIFEAQNGQLEYDYYFVTAGTAARIAECGFTLNLLLEDRKEDTVPEEERAGLYGYRKTLRDFCGELGIPVPGEPDEPEEPEEPEDDHTIITSDGTFIIENGMATFTAPKSKNTKKQTVPDTVQDRTGKKIKVTAITDSACSGMKKMSVLTIGRNVKKIGKKAFESCTALKTVKGGAGVTDILDYAFSSCKKMTAFPVMKNLQSIGACAFRDCTALTGFTIGSKVKTIGKQAYYNCKSMKKLTIQTKKLTEKNVGAKAFEKIYKKAVIKCPKGKTKLYTKWLRKRGVPKTADIR